MKLNRLRIYDFRNLSAVDLTLCEGANILYGENGQGKTNLIEAIWLFTGAKSFRGARDSQMVRFGQPQAALELDFFAQQRNQQATITIESRRVATLNELPLKSPSELAGVLCAVVFSPSHLSLVKNGPAEKRRFLDTSICQLKPRYLTALRQYHRVLEQRNQLLKDLARYPSLYETLDVWDQRLASAAVLVTRTRASYLERLLPYAQEIYAGLSGGRELLDWHYIHHLEGVQGETTQVQEEQIRLALLASRFSDQRAGSTSCGPHRDDLELTLDGYDVRSFASQGQQRSCVLALKLAECELIRELTGEYPVVLLDDVMSELDDLRRDFLLNRLSGRQLVITCCDAGDFSGLQQGARFLVEAGRVQPELDG